MSGRDSRLLWRHAATLAAALAVLYALLPALAEGRTPSELLADRPLAPNDHALLNGPNDIGRVVLYPDAPSMAPAAGSEPTEQQVAAMLDAYLAAEFPGDPGEQADARAIFNDAAAQQKIPSPSLRAAVAALKGTVAEGAIDFVLSAEVSPGTPKITAIRFVEPSAGCGALSTAWIACSVDAGSSGEQRAIEINSRYRAESPFLHTNAVAHEVLHSDGVNSNYEEITNYTFQYLVYLQQLSRHPDLATLGTELARRSNSSGLARLNSGAGSALGLYETNGHRQLFPASTTSTSTSWFALLDQGGTTTTPGGALLGSYLANAQLPGAPTCSPATFSKPLLDCLDASGNSGLSADELVAAGRALKLDFDTDGDRVFDSADACPTTAAATADGCPTSAPSPSGGESPPGGPGGGDGAPAASPSAAQLAAALIADVRAAAKALGRRRIRTLIEQRGFTIAGLDALTAGTFRVKLTAPQPRGSRSHAAVKRIVIAIGSRSAPAADRYTLTARLTAAGKRVLRAARRIKGVLSLRFVLRDGSAVVRSATVELRR